MKYIFKIYDKKTGKIFATGTTDGRGTRAEQRRDLDDLRTRILNSLGIDPIGSVAEYIYIHMQRAEGEFDNGSNIRPEVWR